MTEKKMEHKEMRVDEDELEAMHTKLMEGGLKAGREHGEYHVVK